MQMASRIMRAMREGLEGTPGAALQVACVSAELAAHCREVHNGTPGDTWLAC